MWRLKNNKAPGEDKIPAELYKYGGEAIQRTLYNLIVMTWNNEHVTQQWKDALIVKLFKKGDPLECGNYRGISLLCIAGKVFSLLLLDRLAEIMVRIVPESQCGFRQYRGTTDMIFSARILQEQCRENNVDLYMVFIDLTKAYDTVNRKFLWKLLERFGAPRKLVKLIRLMHDGMKGSLVGDEEAEPFGIENGLRQGCVMAPNLFNVFFAAVFAAAFKDMDECGVEIRYKYNGKLHNTKLNDKNSVTQFIKDLCYADDCALISHNEEELQLFMDKFSEATKKFGLTISFKKTEVMKQSNHSVEEPGIILDGKPLKTTNSFTYLGSTLSNDVSLDAEIKSRIVKASKTFGKLYHRVWKPQDISKNTKLAVYKACVLSVLLYGSATWNLYQRHLKKLESFHHRSIRKILNINWKEFIPTYIVLQRSDMPMIDSIIKKSRLKWVGHVNRMPDHRYPKQLLFSQLAEGKRNRGKPKQRWKDLIKRDFKQCNIDHEKWADLSAEENKYKWRELIHKGIEKWGEETKKKTIEKRRERKRKQKEREIKDIEEGKERPNKCPVDGCNKSYVQKSSLLRHMVTDHPDHEWKRELKCKVCEKTFSTQSGLTRHKCSNTERKTHSCTHPGCGKNYTQRSSLITHIKDTHESKQTSLFCNKCRRKFTTKSGISRHKCSKNS